MIIILCVFYMVILSMHSTFHQLRHNTAAARTMFDGGIYLGMHGACVVVKLFLIQLPYACSEVSNHFPGCGKSMVYISIRRLFK